MVVSLGNGIRPILEHYGMIALGPYIAGQRTAEVQTLAETVEDMPEVVSGPVAFGSPVHAPAPSTSDMQAA